jgi:hypothetical protein
VAVRESDFQALDGDTVAQIYGEVTLPEGRAEGWLAALRGRWSDG